MHLFNGLEMILGENSSVVFSNLEDALIIGADALFIAIMSCGPAIKLESLAENVRLEKVGNLDTTIYKLG